MPMIVARSISRTDYRMEKLNRLPVWLAEPIGRAGRCGAWIVVETEKPWGYQGAPVEPHKGPHHVPLAVGRIARFSFPISATSRSALPIIWRSLSPFIPLIFVDHVPSR